MLDNYDRKGADMRQKIDLPVIIQGQSALKQSIRYHRAVKY